MAFLKPIDHVRMTRFIRRMAETVIETQKEMDRRSLEIFEEMADPEQGFQLPGTDAKRSLLELGFAPPFLHFSECQFQNRLSITITRSGGSEVTTSMPGLPGGIPGLDMFAAPVGPAMDNKYSYPMNESSEISTRMVALPAPAVLMERLKPKPPPEPSDE
ncbi:MAG: hypothetical protein GY856_48500 [bacterium]|nr:hypothetical protein [bacterium]